MRFVLVLMLTHFMNTVMFRIVEDNEPPIPETLSPLLLRFLRACFQKKHTDRPDAEVLYEHEWLKDWGLSKVPPPWGQGGRSKRWALVQQPPSHSEFPFLAPAPHRESQDNDSPAAEGHSFAKANFSEGK
jgi:serine/threonine protein kinase